MRLPEVERLCRAVVPGAGRIDLKALGAGLISETYRVTRDGVAYTLKVAAESCELHADLPWEVQVLERAARAGLAPRLVYSDLDGAVLLTRWAEGSSWVLQEAGTPANLEKIAALLRRDEVSPGFAGDERVGAALRWLFEQVTDEPERNERTLLLQNLEQYLDRVGTP